MRVVSLLPSATEIVYALGVEPVGVSHECDFPPAAAEQPSVNYSHVDPEASSAEIDAQVHEAEREHGGVYGIDVDALDELDPDLIVTQGICDVCAVDEVLVEDAVDEIDANPEVLTTDPHSLADILDDVRRVGAALDRRAEAAALTAELDERLRAVEQVARDADERPEVAVLDWLEPPMVAGHWVPELVQKAGGTYGLAAPGDRSTPREWAEIREYDPEVLVAAPCGFGIDQTLENRADLVDRPGFDDLRAVRDDRAWIVDGHHYVNRPGPRVVDTLEILAGILHPELFAAPDDAAARPFPAVERPL